MAARQWFLVTVTVAWYMEGLRGTGRDLADRVLDLLLAEEDMAGARVSRAPGLGATSMYYRIDVYAQSHADARARAVAPARTVARELGGRTQVTDIQSMSEAQLGEHQRAIRYRQRLVRPGRPR